METIDIIKYVLNSPANTNPNVLRDMLETYRLSGGNISPEDIEAAVAKYLEENPVQPTPIDKTLTKENEAADAKSTGDRLLDKADKATTLSGYGITDGVSINDTLILECTLNLGG